jgi:hypothetical protein
MALATITLTGAAGAQPAQDPDYLLLVNRFGELCTMCEATVACRAGDAAPADVGGLATGPYTLYHFQVRTFWGQVSTIFSYLQRWIEPVVSQTRPVLIYTVDAAGPAGTGRSVATDMAKLSLDPPLIVAGSLRIDRTTGAWQQPDGAPVGTCTRLPLRDTLAFVKQHGPWPGQSP